MKTIVLFSMLGLLLAVAIWGSYWIAKNLSYSFWYKDMVAETIQEEVRQECLK